MTHGHSRHHVPLHALAAALCATALALPGLAAAQVAGTSTTTTAIDSTQATIGWSVKKSIMGKTVYNEAGEKVGKVEDLILSNDRTVTSAIIGAGGYLGMGRHDVAVPVSRIAEVNNRIIMAGATKATIKAMPAFSYADDGTQRAQFIAAAESDLAKARVQIGVLEKKAGDATAEGKVRLNQQAVNLQQDVKQVEGKLGDLRHAASARWKEFSKDVSDATSKLRKSTDAPAS